MGHDQIEAILEREKEVVIKKDVVAANTNPMLICGSYRKHHTYICNRNVQIEGEDFGLVVIILHIGNRGYLYWYLIVHDCSQAHDANVHIILLAHKPGVLDGFAASY